MLLPQGALALPPPPVLQSQIGFPRPPSFAVAAFPPSLLSLPRFSTSPGTLWRARQISRPGRHAGAGRGRGGRARARGVGQARAPRGRKGRGRARFFFLVRGGARLGLGRPGPAHPPHPTMQGWVAVRPLGEGWGRNRLPLSPSRSPALWWPSRMRLGRRCRPTSKNNNNSLPPHPSHAAAMVRTVLITALLAAASTGAFGQG